MESNQAQLQQKLTSLLNTYPNLGMRLSLAAKELQNAGVPLQESLLAELTNYQQDFNTLKSQVLELAKSREIPTKILISLKDIENTFSHINSSNQPANNDSEQAIALLNRVLSLSHKEDNNFAPLQSVKTKAQELLKAVSQAGKNHPDIKSLMTGSHPVAAVLKMVEEQDKLGDEQWLALEEKVTTAFDKKLVLAINRSKLVLTKSVQPQQSANQPVQLPGLEELAKPVIVPAIKVPATAGVNPNTAAPNNLQLPQIKVPATASVANPATNNDIMILEEPIPGKKRDDIIIVPGIQVNQKPSPTVIPPIIPAVAGKTGNTIGLKVLVSIQGMGDRTFGAQEYAGTKGQGLKIEGFQVNIHPAIPGLSLQYMAHIAYVGDTPWTNEGQLVGARGQAKQIEGFALRTAGPEAAKYDVFYTAHIQNVGDTQVYSNGQYCGTKGKSLRVEGLKIWLQPKN
ncbi:MAG: hydrogenase [Microcoleaceae cyanobacterium]